MNRTFRIFLRCAGEIAAADMARKGQADAGSIWRTQGRHRRKERRITEDRGPALHRGRKEWDLKTVRKHKWKKWSLQLRKSSVSLQWLSPRSTRHNKVMAWLSSVVLVVQTIPTAKWYVIAHTYNT